MPEAINNACPHCGKQLEIGEVQVETCFSCPFCEQEFRVGPAPAPGTQESSSSFHWFGGGRKYIWGRLFILLSWILVALVFVVGGIRLYLGHSTVAGDRKERNLILDNKREKILEIQEKVAGNYGNTVDLLAEKQFSGEAAREISGLRLPAHLTTVDIRFSDKLDSLAETELSQKAAERYIGYIGELENCFRQALFDRLKNLERRFGGGTGSTARPGRARGADRSGSIRTGFSTQVDFYLSEELKTRMLRQARDQMNGLLRIYPNDSKLKADLEQLELYLNFIEKNLLSRTISRSIGGLQGNFSGQTPATAQTVTPGTEEFRNLSSSLAHFYRAWVAEQQPNWSIAADARILEEALNIFRDEMIKEERLRQAERQELLLLWMYTLSVCVMLSLFLLVVADYLRAHFDMAETIQKRSGL